MIASMTSQMNQFNQENAKTMQEKIDNILNLAINIPQGELTEGDIMQAETYGELLIDKD